MALRLGFVRHYLVLGKPHMSDKKIRIKMSELRAMIREALAQPIADRQSTDDEEKLNDDDKGKEQLNDADEMVETVSPDSEKREIEEFHSFEQDFAEKLSDKKYQSMAKQIFDAWASKDADVDWAGVVNIFARNHSKNLGQQIDKTKLYEKVLDLVEKHEEP